ncbi:unnamed protein product [Eruca vesicaria subsp. sativa]|uniref:F-box domain-containing protein n=1 Tax=Eruca vesicaria subsp. sativa TaxID=29727 RepID=A0ABC8KWU9_ERUVS|nr:unnamed protein product [Eruca vesicaria subsp. sativa]
MPDLSHLPEELLEIISRNVEDCFVGIHARSVCTSWRSTFPYPACLLRPTYSLPSFADFPYESQGLCTLEIIPLFLLRLPTPFASPCEYFLGRICRDESEGHMELPSPLWRFQDLI